MKPKPLLRIHDALRMAIKADGTKLPVIDSPLSTIIQPTDNDIKNGVPGDHTKCMYCLACRRLFDSELVWVTRTLAYVELKGKGGKPELHRFILAKPAKVAIGKFDAKQDVTPEAVVFAAPKGANRLDAIRTKWHKHQKSGTPKKAYIKGQNKVQKPHPVDPLHVLRSPASGMFQFPHKDK